jgi:hypothetical protein
MLGRSKFPEPGFDPFLTVKKPNRRRQKLSHSLLCYLFLQVRHFCSVVHLSPQFWQTLHPTVTRILISFLLRQISESGNLHNRVARFRKHRQRRCRPYRVRRLRSPRLKSRNSSCLGGLLLPKSSNENRNASLLELTMCEVRDPYPPDSRSE